MISAKGSKELEEVQSVLPVKTTKENKLCNPEVPSQRRSQEQAEEVSRDGEASLRGVANTEFG